MIALTNLAARTLVALSAPFDLWAVARVEGWLR